MLYIENKECQESVLDEAMIQSANKVRSIVVSEKPEMIQNMNILNKKKTIFFFLIDLQNI